VTVDVWSDVVCPWCSIGQARFEKALGEYGGPVMVRLHPFRLDPDAPVPGEAALERYRRKFGDDAETMLERVTATGAAEGLEFRFDRALTANTFDAHRAIGRAARNGNDRALERALFDAYFRDGLDVSDRGVLADAAARAGEDRAEMLAYLESRDGVAELTGELEMAGALGITAVPTFVFNDRFAIPGAVDVATFGKIFEQMQAVPPEAG
jgi:predicted DsbA family dithiol-disulfide isomerase